MHTNPNLLDDSPFTEAELAAELHCGRRTLQRYRYHGKGPQHIVVAGRIMYRRKAVERWLASLETDTLIRGK